MGESTDQQTNGQAPGYPAGQPVAPGPYAPMPYGAGPAQRPAPTPGPVGTYVPGQPTLAQQAQAQQAWAAQAAYAVAPGAYVPPPTSVPYQAPKKKRRWRWVLLVLLLLLLVAAVLCFFLLDCSGSKRSGVAGQLEGKSEAEIQAELDRVVEEGMFNISIASSVQMASPTSPAELRIENVPGNRYLMRVVIVEEATGQQLYETDLIEPNYHIQEDTLDVALSPGNHSCTALFYAYDPATEEEVGQAAARISIQVAG